VIVPEVWTPYMVQRSVQSSALYRSGIIQNDAQLDQLARAGGNAVNMPYWNDLTGRSVPGSDDPDTKITAGKVTSGQDIARIHHRNKSWSTMDLSGVLAGNDPAGQIATLVGDWWARDMQQSLIYSLDGVLADNAQNDSSDMIVNVANDEVIPQGGIPAANKISDAVFLAAQQTMGDAAMLLTAICLHSVIRTELENQGKITHAVGDSKDIGYGTYKGMTVIVDDSCPAAVGTNRITYTSYLFGAGAVGYGEGAPKLPTEIQRDALAGNGGGQETLVSRRIFILHPRGIAFISASVAGVTPTDSEIQNRLNWNRVYERKSVRIAAIKSNG
jgi:hypothetical protein